jgi:predicted nucleic acid-binding protein
MQLAVPTAIFLDELPLSLLTMPRGHSDGDKCTYWLARAEAAGHRFFVPEMADYELRRELLRAGKSSSIVRLDTFNLSEPDRYQPLTTADVRLAASLWAQVRNRGRMGASPEALDADVLIAAQALRFVPASLGLSQTIVATVNVRHFEHVVASALWSEIEP